nr:MAG TPA: hypothetical protein [Caudoviricetes sp.]
MHLVFGTSKEDRLCLLRTSLALFLLTQGFKWINDCG